MELRAFNPDRFLSQFWQKKPLLIRNAFPGFQDPLTRDELAGLSLEEDVESRLVMKRGRKKPWQVIHGPQARHQLEKLPSHHWTLLVQGVDRYVPGVAALLDAFRFLPDWRVDDVMVSFAPRGGTVGPHIDSYDVFLLQGQGRRRWRLDRNASPALKPGLDLRILKQFHADHDWVLEPGDILYLPPGLAHYGTALEECLTYSIGFRAPAAIDLLLAAQERLLHAAGPENRYRDPDLTRSRSPGHVSLAVVERFRALLHSTLDQLTDSEFDGLVGSLLTDPKGEAGLVKRSSSVRQIRSRLRQGAVLSRRPGSRLAYIKRDQSVTLFANGSSYPIHPSCGFAAGLLTTHRQFPSIALTDHLGNQRFIRLLALLIGADVFRLESLA